jgi:pre-mRNA-processing factor 6
LIKHGVQIKRDQWLKEAVNAEESGSIVTCRSIIKETMHYGMDEYIE